MQIYEAYSQMEEYQYCCSGQVAWYVKPQYNRIGFVAYRYDNEVYVRVEPRNLNSGRISNTHLSIIFQFIRSVP